MRLALLLAVVCGALGAVDHPSQYCRWWIKEFSEIEMWEKLLVSLRAQHDFETIEDEQDLVRRIHAKQQAISQASCDSR